MKKLIAMLLVLTLLLAGCASAPAKEEAPAPAPAEETAAPEAEEAAAPEEEAEEAPEEEAPATQMVTDMLGREVELPAEIESMVCMGPSVLRLVTYLGLEDRVAGVEEADHEPNIFRPYNYVHPEFQDLPVLSRTGFEETLAAIHPDVAFLSTTQVESGEAIEKKLNIPVVYLDNDGDIFNVENSWFQSLELVAAICGVEDRAQEILDYTKNVVADLEARTANVEEVPSVYIAGATSRHGELGLDGTIPNYAPFEVLHLNHVSKELDPDGVYGVTTPVDLEKLLEWNPDFIFVNVGNLHLVQDFYKENPGYFSHLTAFENGNFYPQIAYNNYGGSIELAVVDAYYAGSVIYPEAFADVDIDALADEAFQVMVGESIWQEMKDQGLGLVPIVLE